MFFFIFLFVLLFFLLILYYYSLIWFVKNSMNVAYENSNVMLIYIFLYLFYFILFSIKTHFKITERVLSWFL